MKRTLRSAFAPALGLALGLALPGCIEASQEPLDYDAVAVAQGNGTVVVGAWTITLTRADVALGPFYFCASASGSSTLCESSVAEIAGVTVVDALAPAPAPLGRVHGFSGTIASASYDLGISWFDTQRAPTPAPPLPGGHSIRLEGVARSAAAAIPFTADVDVVPQFQGQNAISTAPASADVRSSATRLEVILEPAAWLRQLDFDAAAASGNVPFTITPGTPEHNAVLVGVKNLAPLQFRWAAVATP
jgi:hypothetical protein